ncbi:MAG TPA: response regulator transcription factor [Candidatus Saccharimonadales bacterium]|nr:response regulator transcription factor [Candidatus Saccharimonadales bacterium]
MERQTPLLAGENEPIKIRTYLLLSQDPQLRFELNRYATETGYKLDVARNIEDARSFAKGANYSLLFLDVDQFDPGNRDGIDQMHYVAVSAVNTDRSRIRHLDQGAVLFLQKPFDPTLAPAYINSAVRFIEAQKPQEDTVRVGDLAIDVGNYKVKKSGVIIPLTRDEMYLLVYLAKNRGASFSRDALLSSVWDSKNARESSVTVRVSRLREKIEDDPTNPRYIVTEPYVGYSFTATVEETGRKPNILSTKEISFEDIKAVMPENGKITTRELRAKLNISSIRAASLLARFSRHGFLQKHGEELPFFYTRAQ